MKTRELRTANAQFMGQFATKISEVMEGRGLSVAWLSRELDITYEHVRKICHGLAFPSRYILKDICRLLDLDLEDMQKLVIADKIQNKYGGIPFELAGKTPRFVELERVLPKLTQEQFESLLDMAEGMAKRNRPTRSLAGAGKP